MERSKITLFLFLLYTADSAAVTEENLKLFKEYHVDMISRLPERYGLAEELINQAFTANIWKEIGTLSEGKGTYFFFPHSGH